MGKLVLLRHGQSVWNKKNLFTGWVDVPLSEKGVEEAKHAGKRIRHIPFDAIFVSTLVRAQLTMYLAMMEHDTGKVPVMLHEGQQGEWERNYGKEGIIPVFSAWQLNERMYGELQGVNKDEMRAKYGPEQVKIWRRSFDVAPPGGESLEMTAARTLPYFNEAILPNLEQGLNVLISAHGNSLRSIVMALDGLTPAEVLELEIPTGEPLCYVFTGGQFTKYDLPER